MKKSICYLTIVLFYFLPGKAITQQNSKYDKLQDLYVNRKYEACLRKAEKFTQNDDTRKDAIPYLYLSKSYYELSQSEDPDIQDYYPKALSYALKYAIKFKKKDKKNEFESLSNDYIQKLANTYFEDSKEQYNNGKYSKASSNYKQMLKLTSDDNVLFAKGVCDAFNMNYSEASVILSEAIKNLKENPGAPKFNNSQILLINYGIDYSDLLLRNEDIDSAYSTINILMEFIPDNVSLEAQMDKIKRDKDSKDVSDSDSEE